MRTEPCSPWPRHALTQEEWAQIAGAPAPPLLALWADAREVYALLREPGAEPLFVSTAIEAGAYPALSPIRPQAAWFERMIRDLWGHTATSGTDQRPLLDHGNWPQAAPMAAAPGPPGRPEPPEFLSGEDPADQIPLGPVRGLIEAPAHLRVTGYGESIARLEARLGYAHKGTLALMRGKSPRAAARFAARLSGEATVAHSIAFARATEAALNCEAPARAVAWRGVMAEIERIAGNLDSLAAVAEAMEVHVVASRCAWHGEAMRRAANIAFGHRLMMDCVIPGGVAADAVPGGVEAVGRALAGLEAERDEMEPLAPATAARGWVNEIGESTRLVRNLLAGMPEGALSVPLPAESGEGIGFAASPIGDVWHWLRLDHGQIASVFMCDPGWTQWRLLEAAMAGGQLDDLRLTIASLRLTSSGMDL